MKNNQTHPIALLRQRYNLSQQALADLMRVNIRSIQKWEGGERKCSAAYMLLADSVCSQL